MTEMNIPEEIASRMKVDTLQPGQLHVVIGDPWKGDVVLSAERRNETNITRYTMLTNKGAPTYRDDLRAFYKLKAALMVEAVREDPSRVLELTFFEWRIIEAFAAREDRAFLAETFVLEKVFDDESSRLPV